LTKKKKNLKNLNFGLLMFLGFLKKIKNLGFFSKPFPALQYRAYGCNQVKPWKQTDNYIKPVNDIKKLTWMRQTRILLATHIYWVPVDDFIGQYWTLEHCRVV